MPLTVLQKKHDKIKGNLDKEINLARNMLTQPIEEVCLAEHSKLCSYCISQMNVLSDDLELALEKLSLEVEGTDAVDDLDIQTQKDFALMDTAMELSDKLIILKGTLAKTMEQKEISKVAMYEERLTEMMKTQYEQLQQIITVTSTQISDKEQGEQLLKRCQQIQLNHIKASQEFKTVSNCMSEKQNSAEVEPNIEDKRQSIQDMKQNVTTEKLKEQCIKHKENKHRNKP